MLMLKRFGAGLVLLASLFSGCGAPCDSAREHWAAWTVTYVSPAKALYDACGTTAKLHVELHTSVVATREFHRAPGTVLRVTLQSAASCPFAGWKASLEGQDVRTQTIVGLYDRTYSAMFTYSGVSDQPGSLTFGFFAEAAPCDLQVEVEVQ